MQEVTQYCHCNQCRYKGDICTPNRIQNKHIGLTLFLQHELEQLEVEVEGLCVGEAAGVELGGRSEATSSPVGHRLLDSQGMALKNDRLGLGTTVHVYLGLGQVTDHP